MPAAGEQHAAEGMIVVHGRDLAAAAGLECRRLREEAALGLVHDRRLAGRVGAVHGRQPVELFARHVEAGVLHAERLEQPLLHEVAQAPAGCARDQHAGNVHAGVVEPHVARLVHERQAAEPLHELVGRLAEEVAARRHAGFLHRQLDRIFRRIDHHRADAGFQRQQIAQRDRTPGRNRVVERAVDALQDPAIGKLRQERVDRIVERELAFVDQDHRRSRGERLADRGDAEDRVAPHRRLARQILHAGGRDMGLAVPADQGHNAGGQALFHLRRAWLGQAFPARHWRSRSQRRRAQVLAETPDRLKEAAARPPSVSAPRSRRDRRSTGFGAHRNCSFLCRRHQPRPG